MICAVYLCTFYGNPFWIPLYIPAVPSTPCIYLITVHDACVSYYLVPSTYMKRVTVWRVTVDKPTALWLKNCTPYTLTYIFHLLHCNLSSIPFHPFLVLALLTWCPGSCGLLDKKVLLLDLHFRTISFQFKCASFTLANACLCLERWVTQPKAKRRRIEL